MKLDEIEFRGQRIDNNEWVYGSFITNWYDGIIKSAVIIVDDSATTGIIDERLTKYYVTRETVGIYTGIKYKTKEKMFSGDRIKSAKGEMGTVIFENGNTYVAYDYGSTNFIAISNSFVKVGTIHDNKDLFEWK
jgi:hypothetical protein